MTKWEYGGAYKKYDIVDGEIYKIKDKGEVMVHDLTKGLPEFMKKADVIFVDPPWNKGNLSTFYTKADKNYRLDSYEFFYQELFNSIKEIEADICFVEIGKQYLSLFIEEMKKIYKHVTFYNSSYYHRKDSFCYIVQGSKKRVNYKLDGIDEEDIIAWICKNIDYNCIADLCMGQGLVGYHSYINGKNFVGTELNKKRLGVTIDRIETLEED